jgi:hypothetical protein
LCFLAGLAGDYVEAILGDKVVSPDDALSQCTDRLTTGHQPHWAATDIWFKRVLAPPPHPLGTDAGTSDFCRIALAVLAPMVESLVQHSAEAWLRDSGTAAP